MYNQMQNESSYEDDDKLEICKECNRASLYCKSRYFKRNFKNWTSNNKQIDKFIQDTQLSAHRDYEESDALRWITYDKFHNIEYIAKGGFGKVYRANWIDENLIDKNKVVALKSLNNSKNVTSEFMSEVIFHHKVCKGFVDFNIIKFYGITQDPETKNYMMVLDYAENGNLRNYLNKINVKLSLKNKINDLWCIAFGLKHIHNNELIHRDLHIGNILHTGGSGIYITDLGLCKPADCNISKNLYGVLPYVAPEILRGQNYTKAADIYSFGIIMYEVISELPPYYDVAHDENLALKICKGFRPRFNIKVPLLIVRLIKRCLDANSSNRPTAEEIDEILFQWWYPYEDSSELDEQIKKADEINNKLSINNLRSTNLGLSYETHTEATYTSRLLSFNNLPSPKNSDDYYDQDDNIISLKFSESLQIDISWLKINESDHINDEFR